MSKEYESLKSLNRTVDQNGIRAGDLFFFYRLQCVAMALGVKRGARKGRSWCWLYHIHGERCLKTSPDHWREHPLNCPSSIESFLERTDETYKRVGNIFDLVPHEMLERLFKVNEWER